MILKSKNDVIPLNFEGADSHKYDSDDMLDGSATERGSNDIRVRVKEDYWSIGGEIQSANLKLRTNKVDERFRENFRVFNP